MQNEMRNQRQNDPPLRLPTIPPAIPNHIRMTMNCQPATGRLPDDGLQGPEDGGDHRDGYHDPEDRQNGVNQQVETDRDDCDENQARYTPAHQRRAVSRYIGFRALERCHACSVALRRTGPENLART